MTQSFFLGYTFSGILIAFLARNNPIVAILVALFVAVLFVAGQSLQVFYQIPGSMVQLIQAIIVIAVAYCWQKPRRLASRQSTAPWPGAHA